MSNQQLAVPVQPGEPPELVVCDELAACPYLPGRVARMPLRLPCRPLRHRELDQRLAAGDRRQGYVLYRTACPDCRACQPLRVDACRFSFSRNQRRTLRRGDRRLTVSVGRPSADARRVELYNVHKKYRGLSDGRPALDLDGYTDFLVGSCCDTLELSYWDHDLLVGVAVVDRALNSLSAVYCCYDPHYSGLSLGTYSILKQIELCRQLGMRHLYLGLYIEESRPMAYKARFRPHQRLRSGRWESFV